MAKVTFNRGTYAQYSSVPEKSSDELYFTLDTHQIFLGETLMADAKDLNVSFVTAVPEFASAVEDVLYVVTEGDQQGIFYKGASTMVQAGGGEATEVADGILTLSNFVAGVVASEIGEGSADAIPTTAAVKAYTDSAVQAVSEAVTALDGVVDGTISNVTVQTPASQGSPNTVLRFTKVDGTYVDVTIADIFLASASYDSETHDLTLTLNDASSSTVVVNLDDLIGNSLSDVTVGEDEAFTVQLGAGVTLGGFKTGDQITATTSIETILKKLLTKAVPPTYTDPTVSVANNSGTAGGSYEYGTSVTPNIRATFTQNDAGALTNIQFQKNNSNVGDPQTSSPATYSEAQFSLTATTTFRAIATYAEGAIKDNNLGEPSPEGHIEAGSVNSNTITFTPFRNVFYGATVAKPTVDSAYIRGLTAKGSAYGVGQILTFTAPLGAMRVTVAYPETASSNKPKFETLTGLTMDVSDSFTSSTVSVNGANNSEAVNYTVWTFEPAEGYDPATDFRVTLK